MSTFDGVEKNNTVTSTATAREPSVDSKRERKEEETPKPENAKEIMAAGALFFLGPTVSQLEKCKCSETEASSSVSRIKQPSVSRQASKERNAVSRSTSQEKSIATVVTDQTANASSDQLKESTSVSGTVSP